MYFWNKFCGFLTIFFLSAFFSTAQKVSYVLPITANRPSPVTLSALTKNQKEILSEPRSLSIVNQSYYTQHMGFMCKKELALEKITRVPLRFRLGSLQQCNSLE